MVTAPSDQKQDKVFLPEETGQTKSLRNEAPESAAADEDSVSPAEAGRGQTERHGKRISDDGDQRSEGGWRMAERLRAAD